ncbi:MAG TPA: HAD-IIA family hydrolase [Microbacterium sp.]|uniref:HAD-IIA family hydrolase n=1 Tax=Microbacterium sp. TaxID=51671 RepID=UPI002CCB35DD|nr:HAD-IIA family hydrolase [Microbacterium sp.]HWI32407.1 HAD-IIA family hydrolase [Microbacterium sp.]
MEQIKGIMFDVDGCLVLSDKPSGESGTALPGAAELLRELRAAEIPIVVFTNGSSRTPTAIADELRRVGLDVRDDEVLTPAIVAAQVLRDRHPGGRVLAFGGTGVTGPLLAAGIDVMDVESAISRKAEDVAAVVVGWDTEFGRAKIQAAAEALHGGAALYCTSDAPAFASRGRLNVGVSGFIAVGLQHVTGVPYELVGKPADAAMTEIARRLSAEPDEILIVGDDLTLECSMARRHGALAILITTGMTSRAQAEAADGEASPHHIVDSMFDLSTVLAPLLNSRNTVPAGR